MEQKELQQMTATFPPPRLDIDDGNQATADLHAREDLLLDHYSAVDGQGGTIRIPIYARDGVDCAARPAGERGYGDSGSDGGRCGAGGAGSVDDRICADRI